jgi:hypothetical protein
LLITKPHSLQLDDRSGDRVLRPILGHTIRFDPGAGAAR